MTAPGETAWICVQCGVQVAPCAEPPARCTICDEERQFVNPAGQSWTTHANLLETHANLARLREPHLWGLRTVPRFAIGQEAHVVETASGNVLWDCLSVVDPSSRAWIDARGGLAAIAISHPHFYASAVEWSRAFGDAPIYLHEADTEHVQRPDSCIVPWRGDRIEVVSGVDMVHCGGHFAGSCVLHWPAGATGRGVLLTSDTIQLVVRPRRVTFMYSYPNVIPLSAFAVRRIRAAIADLPFDRIYGSFAGCIAEDARAAVLDSADRYLAAIGAGGEGDPFATSENSPPTPGEAT